MAISTELVEIDCPIKKCHHQLKAEVNADWENMSDDEQAQLKAQVRNRLLPGLKKHHKDGHPKS